MKPTCPKCKESELTCGRVPHELSGDHELLNCEGCHGTWLSRATAEQMVQAGDPLTLEDVEPDSSSEADRRTGVCPHRHGIMLRARVHLSEPFYLERCPHCGGIWFDAGEWNRLAGSYLLEHLEDFWDPAWQQRMRKQLDHKDYEARLREELGEEVFEQLVKLAGALKDHPRRGRALAYLRQETAS